jgi:hypothetical protein
MIVTGDVVEDQSVPLFGDAVEDVISVHHYQIGLNNPENAAFITDAIGWQFVGDAAEKYELSIKKESVGDVPLFVEH